MKKIIFLTLIGLGIAIFSCDIKQKDDEKNPGEIVAAPKNQTSPESEILEEAYEVDEPKKNSVINNPEPEKSREPKLPYDTKALDERLVKEALSLGKDPKTYRMPFRQDPRGGEVFRELGMFVIVNPNGEEVYLPDEI